MSLAVVTGTNRSSPVEPCQLELVYVAATRASADVIQLLLLPLRHAVAAAAAPAAAPAAPAAAPAAHSAIVYVVRLYKERFATSLVQEEETEDVERDEKRELLRE